MRTCRAKDQLLMLEDKVAVVGPERHQRAPEEKIRPKAVMLLPQRPEQQHQRRRKDRH